MKPSEFLDTLDSHGIYAASALDDLDPEYREHVPTFSHERTYAAIEQRGLGGELKDDTGEELIYGYATASALARHVLGSAPGDKYFGRGSAFRENVAAIREAGL